MDQPTFRSATKEDEDEIRLLIFSILGEFGLDPNPKTTDADLFDIAGYYEGGAFEVLTHANGALMGTFGLRKLDARRCELRKMYLDAKYRGKGYGKRMLRHAVARAKELGYSRIELETARVLEAAISLYKKNGFEPFDRPEIASRCDQALALNL